MKRTFIASVLSLSLATSSISTPVSAGEEELGQVLAGALALFVLGKAIENNSQKVQTSPKVQTPVNRDRITIHKPHPPRHRALPASCMRQHLTQEGHRRVLGKTCLQNTYRAAHRLPAHCERKLWTSKGVRFGYSPKCLRSKGFHVSNRY